MPLNCVVKLSNIGSSGVPALNESILSSSFYLYPSEDEAQCGVSRGGTGFVVVVLEQAGVRGLLYAVTAGHVIGQADVLRFNRRDGSAYIVRIPDQKWHRSVDHDLAVTSLFGLPTNELDLFLMPLGLSLTRERCEQDQVTVGDEVFIVGRFLGHDGKERNLPAARFGNIAMMPRAPIENPYTGLRQESFLVEVRSLAGYSGSPVFMYRGATFGPSTRLIGVVWGHIEHRTTRGEEVLIENAGMAGVVPSWGLIDLLYEEEVACERRELIPGFDEVEDDEPSPEP